MLREQKWAMVALVIAMALWGSSFIALKLAFAEVPPLWVIAGRMVLGTLVFLALIRFWGPLNYRRGDWKYLSAMAVVEPCMYFSFEAVALQNTSASQAGMVLGLLPVLIALGAYLFLRERITRKAMLGFAIAFCGALWLSLSGEANEQAPNPLVGNFFEFLAVLCAATYTLLLKHLSARYTPVFLTALQSMVGVVFFIPLALSSSPLPSEVSGQGLAAVVYLGVVVTAGAYGLFNYGVSRLPASRACAFDNLLPLFTLIFAATILGERLSAQQMVAAVVVFAGVILSQWPSTPADNTGVQQQS